MRKNSFLLMLLVLPVFLFSQQVARTLTAANGQTIGFYEFTPSDYGSQRHPVIIFLHGIAERGNGTTQLNLITKVAMPKYLKTGRTMRFYVDGKWQSFVVLSPQLSTSYGSWQHFYVDEMIKYATANLKIDPNRIFLTGLSLGGGGVWSYASASSANASKLAGIIPVCGTCGMSNAANIVNNNVAVYAFHGEQDNKVTSACSKNAINAIKKLNPSRDALLQLYQTTSHVIWDRAYDTAYKFQKPNVFEWMLRQSKTGSTPPPQPIPPPNQAPIAKAGANQSITLPISSVTLNGSGSTDADGRIDSYAWSKISGPSSFTISNPAAVSTEVKNLVEGVYVFRLTIKDDNGASATSDISITVVKSGSATAPTAVITGPSSLSLPISVASLSGSSSSSPNGAITKYRWEKVSGPASFQIISPNNKLTNVAALIQGTYVFRLTVTDAKNATASVDFTLTVSTGGSTPPPSTVNAVITAPSTITLPTNQVLLSGTNSSSQGSSIAKYRWEKISGPASFTLSGPNNRLATLGGLVEGTYGIRLTVTDAKGATGSQTTTITVQKGTASSQSAGSAKAVITGPSTASGSIIILDGSSSSSSTGSINSYRWSQVNGPVTATILGKNNRKTEIAGLSAGNYVFRLTVTDQSGQSDQSDKTVTISSASSSTRIASQSVMEAPLQQIPVIAEGISVYPNPAISVINVQNNAAFTGSGSYNIYDFNGKLVKRQNFVKNQVNHQQSIDVSGLSAGVYHLETVIGTSFKTTSKFIKQ